MGHKDSERRGRKETPDEQGRELKKRLRDFVRVHADRFLEDPNITSVGVGYRVTGGKRTEEICLQFTVASKPEVSGVSLEELDTTPIPETLDIGGGITVATDVLQREFRAGYTIESPQDLDERKRRVDVLRPGISVSHPSGTAGTLGLVVYDRVSGEACLLSNWHVLHRATGNIGDAVVQPGPFDDSDIGRNRAGTLVRSHLGPPGDCAIARIEDRGFDGGPLELDVLPRALGRAELGDRVIKSGRTTGVTLGIVRRVDVMTRLEYQGVGPRNIGGFEIAPLDGSGPGYEVSMGGDSGAAWFFADESGRPTDVVAGLHFAGESGMNPDEHAMACYAHAVFQKLLISLEPPAARDAEGPETAAGYNPDFTTTRAPRPWLTDAQYEDAVKLSRCPMIPYTHFSVCLSKERRLARFVAWNIDGSRIRRLSRDGIDFKLDPRVPAELQWDNRLYVNNELDRGHIARRADLVWGGEAEAARANLDSFYFTNIAPQHSAFNRSSQSGIWGELENAIFADVDVADLRISAMGGPVFRDSDAVYRGARIPRDFWKLLAFTDTRDGRFKVAAYVLTQRDLITDLEALELDPYAVYQVSLEKLHEETQLDFSALSGFDTFGPGPRPEALPEGVVARARRVDSVAEVTRGVTGDGR